ncbi:MAG: helix-turn-helix transcriptional regulator [Vulcanimicrobiota bacterium]
MSYLKQAREKLGLSQTEAAGRLQIPRQQLNRLERGKALATSAQAASILGLYGVAALSSQELERGRRTQERTGLRPFEFEQVNPEPWRAAHKFWGHRITLEPEIWRWMSHFIPADSSHECYGWGQFGARGARPLLGNPVHWGFDQHVLVDGLGRLLAARLLPALGYESPERDLVIWPQMWMCTGDHTFRVDGLVFLRLGKRRHWLVLELDGKGHNAAGDEFRKAQLAMPEVRLTGEEIRAGQFFELLLERVRQAPEQVPPPPPAFKSGWRGGRRRGPWA